MNTNKYLVGKTNAGNVAVLGPGGGKCVLVVKDERFIEGAHFPDEICVKQVEGENWHTVACAEIGTTPSDLRARRLQLESARAAIAEKQRRAKAEQEAAELAAAVVDPLVLLSLALRHTEQARWHNAGSWSNKRWRLVRQRTFGFEHELVPCVRDRADPEWQRRSALARRANESTYEALVDILGRRAWNNGGGNRQDVTEATPNDPKRVRLARAIIARKRVRAKALFGIANQHARAWAVERTGGWGRIAKACRLIERTKHGALRSLAEHGVTADLLVVTCPTTGQKYALLVPRKRRHHTVANALKAVNGLPVQNLVAQT